MNIFCVPTEILQIILEMLDSESKLAVWKTCQRLRVLLRNKRVMRHLTLSGEIEESVLDLAPFVSELVLTGTLGVHTFPYASFENIRCLDLTNINLHGDEVQYLEIMCHLQKLPQLHTLAIMLDIFYHRYDNIANKMLQMLLQNLKQLEHICFLVHSIVILQCHYVFQIIQLCNSLHTVHIDVKEIDVCNGNVHFHTGCHDLAIPPALRIFSVFIHDKEQYTDLHLLEPFLVAGWERISFNSCVVDAIELAATKQLLCLLLPAPFVFEGDLDESRCFNFHRLYCPDLDTYYPNAFKCIASNVKAKLPHVICQTDIDTVHSDTKQSGQIYCICPFSLPKLHSEGIITAHEFNLTSVVPLICDMRVLIRTCREHSNYDGELKHVLRADGGELASVHLRQLSYLNLDFVPLIGDLDALFKNCINIRTLVLTNHLTTMSYKEVVHNLYMLPALRNFSCHDVSVSPEDLVAGCAKCHDLCNVELYFYKSLPSSLGPFLSNCKKLKTLKIIVSYYRLLINCVNLLEPFEKEGFKFDVEPRDGMTPPLCNDFAVIQFSEFVASTGLKLSYNMNN